MLAGCAARKAVDPVDPRRGDVAVRTIENSAGESYPDADKGESYDSPVPFPENAAPQYPENLLIQKLPPVKVGVRLIVDERGNVTQVSPLDPAASADPAFLAAVEAAARTWHFTPLVRFGRGAGSTTIEFNGWAQTYEGVATALPFHQDYEFTFTQRDGKGFVSSSNHE